MAKRNLRKREIKLRQRRSYFPYFFLLFFICLIYFILSSPLFSVKKIEIGGNSAVTSWEILKSSQLRPEENIFLLYPKKIKSKIKKCPRIKEVHLKRILPEKVFIRVLEREPRAILKIEDSYLLLDKEAYIIASSPCTGAVSYPIFTNLQVKNCKLGEKILSPQINKALLILSLCESHLKKKVYKISFDEKNNLFLYIQGFPEILLGKGEDLKGKISYLPVFIKAIKENKLSFKRIDLRYKDKAYGKMN